jgi:hypothetical protein
MVVFDLTKKNVNFIILDIFVFGGGTKGVGKLRSTQFVANLELHILSKVTTHKISPTLNNFKDHI